MAITPKDLRKGTDFRQKRTPQGRLPKSNKLLYFYGASRLEAMHTFGMKCLQGVVSTCDLRTRKTACFASLLLHSLQQIDEMNSNCNNSVIFGIFFVFSLVLFLTYFLLHVLLIGSLLFLFGCFFASGPTSCQNTRGKSALPPSGQWVDLHHLTWQKHDATKAPKRHKDHKEARGTEPFTSSEWSLLEAMGHR